MSLWGVRGTTLRSAHAILRWVSRRFSSRTLCGRLGKASLLEGPGPVALVNGSGASPRSMGASPFPAASPRFQMTCKGSFPVLEKRSRGHRVESRDGLPTSRRKSTGRLRASVAPALSHRGNPPASGDPRIKVTRDRCRPESEDRLETRPSFRSARRVRERGLQGKRRLHRAPFLEAYFWEFIRKLKNRFCGSGFTGSARSVSGVGSAKARVLSKMSLRPRSKSVGER